MRNRENGAPGVAPPAIVLPPSQHSRAYRITRFFVPKRRFIRSADVRCTFWLDAGSALLYSPFTVATVTFPAVIMRGEGAPSYVVSMVMAALPIGQLLTLLWPRLIDGWGKRRTVFGFGIAARLLLITLALVYNPLVFAIVFILVNILEQAKGPAYGAVMQQVYPDENRGKLMANVRVGASLGNIAASAVLGRLLEIASYRVIMPIAGVFGVFSALLFSRVKYEETPTEKKPPFKITYLLTIPKRDKAYGAFLLATFLSGFLNWVIASLYPYLLVDDLHTSSFVVGVLSAASNIAGLASYMVWGRYLDRHHPMLLTFFSFGFTALTAVIYGVAWNEWILLPAALCSGIANSGFDLAFINTAIRFPKDRADVPHYLALYSALVGLRGLIAPFLVGALVGVASVRVLIWVTVALMVLGLANFYRVQRQLLKSGAI